MSMGIWSTEGPACVLLSRLICFHFLKTNPTAISSDDIQSVICSTPSCLMCHTFITNMSLCIFVFMYENIRGFSLLNQLMHKTIVLKMLL